jgi:hypothetical protein
VRLESANDLNKPAIRALIAEALRRAAVPIESRARVAS